MNPVHKFWLLDALDILLVAVLFYRLLVWSRARARRRCSSGSLVLVIVSASSPAGST